MPYSDNRLKPAVLKFFEEEEFVPDTVLDVGCGAGSNYEFYKPFWPNSHWTGLEVFPAYVKRFSLADRYQKILLGDVRDEIYFDYDLVIFGDVLEHLPKVDALRVLDGAVVQARYVLVSLPIGHYPQGEWEGNEHEAHLSEWSEEEFVTRGDFLYGGTNETTGSFVLSELA